VKSDVLNDTGRRINLVVPGEDVKKGRGRGNGRLRERVRRDGGKARR
jgi:hypothetical protein